jgi:phospholipase C
MVHKRPAVSVAAALTAAAMTVLLAQVANAHAPHHTHPAPHHTHHARHHAEQTSRHMSAPSNTATPIRHLVVIFQENVSFDHYFGTYPHAANSDGQPFHASPNTPSVNGLNQFLLTQNPNGANPQRLGPAQAVTCSQDHDYTPEQQAFDHGLMDKFLLFTNTPTCSNSAAYTSPTIVMDYYDGNTVTALWNYGQHFAMSDNSYGTTFGPSTPGALNLVSGQTHGATPAGLADNTTADGTVIGDPDPGYDDCSGSTTVGMSSSNRNIGDLLNSEGVTWGWFQGGFKPTGTSNGKAVCGSSHTGLAGNQKDYSPHHEPFQYYASTSNPHHLPPSSVAMIGKTDQANHQYDLSDFWAAVDDGNLPAVSFLKAARYQDGHPGNSDPIDEQHFIVTTINRLERTRAWHRTAVVIAYDDSDGWYDHVMGPITNQSQDAQYDALTDPGQCGNDPSQRSGGFNGRCGYGPRLPLLVVSPYARNSVDHSITDQSSILRFIEDNWLNGARIDSSSFDNKAGTLDNLFRFSNGERSGKLFLNPCTGEPGNAAQGQGGIRQSRDTRGHRNPNSESGRRSAAGGPDPNAVNCPAP